uniref:Uncharacterized protein n=1 Tax=Glossina austeni TaxID=7395 RepID=A0A1A9VEF8_GLOAU
MCGLPLIRKKITCDLACGLSLPDLRHICPVKSRYLHPLLFISWFATISFGINPCVASLELLDLTSPNPLKSTESHNCTRQNDPVSAVPEDKDKCFSPEVGYADAARTPALISSKGPSLPTVDSIEMSALLLTIATNAIWKRENDIRDDLLPLKYTYSSNLDDTPHGIVTNCCQHAVGNYSAIGKYSIMWNLFQKLAGYWKPTPSSSAILADMSKSTSIKQHNFKI